MKRMYGLEEITFNQGDFGGEAIKPTTWGGNLSIEVPKKKNEAAKSRSENRSENRIKDSKSLARWAPGLMREVARSLQQQILGERIRITKLSWREHIQHGHIPFRKDCRICQEASAKAAPHRRVVGVGIGKARAGVLSVDTSGPLVKGKDVDGGVARFMLVGAFTWIVPKDSKLEEGIPEEVREKTEDIDLVEDSQEYVLEDPAEEEEKDDEEARQGKRKRGRPRKIEIREDDEQMEEEEIKKAQEEEAEEEEKPPDDFEVRTYRMVIPMTTKGGEEVLRGVAEMVTRLALEGFVVRQLHSDHGGEFTTKSLARWTMQRGIARTFTGVSDPQSNGRVENSVQVVKSYVRRTIVQAGLKAIDWPLATRYVNELMRFARLGLKKTFPPFWAEVLVKKRRWDAQQMEPTMEKVRYIAPSPWNYGHWVQKEDGSFIVTRFCIASTVTPVTDEAWIGLERQGRDPLEVRRRIRGKTTVRMMMAKDEDEEESEEERPVKARIATLIAEEMGAMAGEEDERHWRVTMEMVTRLRKMSQESEEDEVLQTRVVP